MDILSVNAKTHPPLDQLEPHLMRDSSTLMERIRYGFLVFVASVLAGYGVFYSYYLGHVNRGFGGKTDIIGYPAFYNYNSNALFYGYLLGLIAAVGASILLIRYVDLQRLESFLPRLLPIVLASPIIAFALVVRSTGPWYGWATISLSALALFKLVAFLIDRRRKACGKSAPAECTLSITLAVTVPALLFYISQNTGWRADPHNIVHIRWFPLPVLIAAEIVVLAFGVKFLRRAEGARLLENYSICLILIPALIYCLTASLPTTPVLDDFHGGEKLAPLALGLRGALPWRDFLFIHGVWDDFLQFYIPARLWEASPRTAWAGTALLFAPIYRICFYLFFLIVFDFSVVPALIAFLISFSLYVPDALQAENLFAFRFILYPVVLICLYKAFCSKRTILWPLFIASCGIQVLLAPEFALLALCFGFTIILRDLLERDSQRPWRTQFRPTLVCGATSVIFILAAVWLLSSWGMLQGFVMMTVQLARGHLQTGAIPVQPIKNLLWVTAIPLLFIVGSIIVFAQSLLRSRKEVPPIVWMLWATAVCTAVYYPKYIARPDNHIAEVFVFAEPGIALLTVFLLEEGRRSLRTHYRPWVLTMAGVFVLSLLLLYRIPGDPFQPRPWFDYIRDQATLFRDRFITTNQNTDFASLSTNATTAARAAALRRFFDAHLHPGDAVFDFSDSPTTFFAILQLKPASRFIHISLAIQGELQREVVKDLETTRPPYVIYYSDGGLNGWDGIPNEVRHYLVARYINLHYVYDRAIEGSIIFRRADIPGEPLDEAIPANLLECQLGYLPNAFALRAPPHARESALDANPTTTTYLQLDGWAALPGGSPADVVVSYNGTVLDRFRPTSIRKDVDKYFGRTLGLTGFSRSVALPDPGISAKDLKFSSADAASGKLFPFGRGPLHGSVDMSSVLSAVSLLDPRGERPAYLFLQFDDSTRTEAAQQFFIISPRSPGRIEFMKVSGNNELLLPLGGCYAWATISKATPQIGSSRPFSLKSAFYFSE